MQNERMFVYTPELREADFTQPPEVLDAVNMVMPDRKFVVAMLHSVMLFIPVIHQPVIRPKTVGIDDRFGVGFALNNRQQFAHRAVFDDLGVHSLAPFEHPENGDFTRRAAPSFAPHPMGAEVAFIEFHFAIFERCFRLADLGYSLAKSVVKLVDRGARNTRQLRRLFSLDIEAKKTNYLSRFALRNVRNFYILIFHCPLTTYKDNYLVKLS